MIEAMACIDTGGKRPSVTPHTGNRIPRTCAELGVEIIPVTKKAGPGQTTARAAVHSLCRSHGEGHLILVLRTLMESEGNSDHINEFTLYGINDIVLSHPAWPATGLRWLEAFDRIDLGDIRAKARRNRAAVPQRYGIASALHRELSAIFDRANQVQFTRTEESSMPIDNDLLYGTRAIASYLELSVPKYHDLISLGGIPTFTMPGSSTRCARKSSLNATWQKYEQAAQPRAMAG
jgi:hypothetical protein